VVISHKKGRKPKKEKKKPFILYFSLQISNTKKPWPLKNLNLAVRNKKKS
jgi:hypothetical protein